MYFSLKYRPINVHVCMTVRQIRRRKIHATYKLVNFQNVKDRIQNFSFLTMQKVYCGHRPQHSLSPRKAILGWRPS